MKDLGREDWLPRHRITVHEYHRMAKTGLLAPDARVELIEGEIIDMPPLGNPHMAVVDRLNRLLLNAVGERAIVRVQGSVRLGRFSEPQPDAVLLKPREDFYASRSATPEDCLLVVEASDSTLRKDYRIKVPLYARHGVPEVWIVDINGKQIHFFRSPVEGEYTDVSSTAQLGAKSIALLPDVTVDLSRLLG